ncbi:MAG: hypothetical protein HY539_01215, partial [Deltaproteobacteria bacterium]|nr:hypothetical protein [Deltaproteobacteria bacterium]
HWGQNLDPDKEWWKVEGQSWDRKDKIFMVIGYSNPEWTDQFDLRKSADLNARGEAASFMQSLVQNYMEEIRGKNFAVGESMVKASSKEALLGSVIVSRHYEKKPKKYYSLLKVDLSYFFGQIYDRYKETESAKLRRSSEGLSGAELDQKIAEVTAKTVADLKEIETSVVEKTLSSKEGR